MADSANERLVTVDIETMLPPEPVVAALAGALNDELDVPGQVVDAIAAAPTVTAAAAAATTAAVAAQDLVHGDDARLPRVETSDDYSVAITDNAGYLTWLAAKASDGGIPPYSADLIGAQITAARLPAQTKTDLTALVGGSLGVERKDVEDVLVAFVGSDDTQTWLAARATDGGPTDWALAMLLARIGPIGVADAAVTLAKLAPDVLARLFPDPPPVWSPVITQITCFGDSLTKGGGPAPVLGTETYGYVLSTLLTGVTVNVKGVSGQYASEIGVRQGGVVLNLTVAGGSIPTSGAVTVTPGVLPAWSGSQNLFNDTATPGGIAGTLAGVPGLLARVGTSSAMQFTRSSGGSAVAVSGTAPFIPAQGVAAASHAQFLWAGRNDVSGSGSVASVVNPVLGMASALSAHGNPFLVFSVTTSTTETSGTAGHTLVTAINAQLAALFGNHYFDVLGYLRTTAITDAGITPTSNDVAQMAAGTIPESLTVDGLHFTAVAYDLIARRVKAKLISMGWV